MDIESILSKPLNELLITISPLYLIAIYIIFKIIKYLANSPKITIDLIDHIKKRKIKYFGKILENKNSLESTDIDYLKKQERLQIIKYLTKIHDSKKALHLFKIIKKHNLDPTYFVNSAIYIREKNKKYYLNLGLRFWLFDWFTGLILSSTIILLGILLSIIPILRDIHNIMLYPLILIISISYIFAGIFIWKQTLPISKIKQIKYYLKTK